MGSRAVPPPEEGPRMPGEDVGGGRAMERRGVGCGFDVEDVDVDDVVGGVDMTGPAIEA